MFILYIDIVDNNTQKAFRWVDGTDVASGYNNWQTPPQSRPGQITAGYIVTSTEKYTNIKQLI